MSYQSTSGSHSPVRSPKRDKHGGDSGGGDVTSNPEMTLEEIKKSCIENDGYETPELNEKLYLHFRGFRRIQNLEMYTNCKSIWLDSNGLEKIEGLEPLFALRCLFLSKNLLTSIGSGLNSLSLLTVLDLSYNRISKLEGLGGLLNLESINVSRNVLTDGPAIEELKKCPKLQTVDLTHNSLSGEDVLDELSKISTLLTLSITGNEVTRIQSFRKKMITMIPSLKYLDRPIDEIEVIGAKAFMEGGVDAESVAKQSYRENKAAQKRNEVEEFLQWQKDHRRKMLGDEENAGIVGNVGVAPYISNMSDEEMAENAENVARGEQQTKTWAGKMLYGGVSYAVPPGERIEENVISPITNMDGSEVNSARSTDNFVVSTGANVDTITEIVEHPDRSTSTIDNMPPPPPTKEELRSAGCYITPASEMTNELSSTQDRIGPDVTHDPATTVRPVKHRLPDALSVIEKQISDMNLDEESITAAVQENQEQTVLEAPKTLYWSEEMDMELAFLVRTLQSDFPKIAQKIRSRAENNDYGNLCALSVDLITTRECQSRWNALDASQWSELAPNTSSLDAVHKIFINPNILGDKGQGHGAQPSYDQLRTISAGSVPSYLKTPSLFPSTSLQEQETDDEQPIKIPSLQEAISQLVSLD